MIPTLQAGQFGRSVLRPAAVGTTWNPADKEASVVLSNGNLTATDGVMVRAIASASTGKRYYEAQYVFTSGPNQSRIGIATAALSTSTRVGSGANSAAVESGGYTYLNNGVPTFVHAVPWSSGDIIGIAVDLGAGHVWYSRNGTWVPNTGGSAGDPSAGTNPRTTGLPAGTYYPACTPEAVKSFTARFAAADWTYSAPTGFVAW